MKNKRFWAPAIGLAIIGMLLPQSVDAAATNMNESNMVNEAQEAEGHNGHISQKPAIHHKSDMREIHSLLEKGHSKEDVFQAAHIARLSKKRIEEVLTYYKKSKSWEQTAEHFGVSPEKVAEHRAKWKAHKKQFEQHKEEILGFLEKYTNKDVSELKGYLKEDVRLHHLVKAAVVAKLSDKDLKAVIQYKKQGHSREEMMNHFNVNHDEMDAEMKKVWSEIKSIME
ncbi:hypothetical protein [Pseudalkalibacillus salsuginis]|uniref:hypothetical protein n=1 Tax=Pseudalkalibacillus salsuginis TaxID=2910972 RepID=UPI001F1AB02A|nr:hypothetical protein [Pseudalkalibacillus salsuginis]MCF6411195.1 hypothetical protein [Pseudalkalibacillus salsuginis]